jgi:peptidoglycan/LPS O-acetylase OafA/YrhL
MAAAGLLGKEEAAEPAASPQSGHQAPAGIQPGAYMPELESLRGLAILLVVSYHMGLLEIGTTIDPASIPYPLSFVRAGHTGVSLFFVLSAFLLSQPFIAEARGGRRVVRRRYCARRVLRILPLYYTAVVLVAVYEANHVRDLLNGIPYLFFLNPVPPTLGQFSRPWWSLAPEAQFYLVLPLVPFLVRSRVGIMVGIGFVVVYGLWLFGYPQLGHTLQELSAYRTWLSHSLLGQGPVFLCGVLAAWLYQRHGPAIRAALEANPLARFGGADLVFVAVLAALCVLLHAVTIVGPVRLDFSPLQVWHALEGALWAMVVLLILLAPLRTKPILANGGLERLGTVSYSLYLVHGPVIVLTSAAIRTHFPQLIRPWNATTLAIAVGIGLTSVAVASVTYWIIERPFLTRKVKIRG